MAVGVVKQSRQIRIIYVMIVSPAAKAILVAPC